MTNEMSRQESIEKLRELIDDIEVAMLTTVEADGSLRSRPMITQKVDEDGKIWFFTSDKGGKAQEIMHERHVNLSYAEPSDSKYVSVSGLGNIVHDRVKMEELWDESFRAWFPDGLDEPDLALLHVVVTQAEYWDSVNNTLVTLAGYIKAVATGEASKGGENKTLNI